MLLIINDSNYGEVETYQQDRISKQWIFKMKDNSYVALDFEAIKRFTSSGNLEIVYKRI